MVIGMEKCYLAQEEFPKKSELKYPIAEVNNILRECITYLSNINSKLATFLDLFIKLYDETISFEKDNGVASTTGRRDIIFPADFLNKIVEKYEEFKRAGNLEKLDDLKKCVAGTMLHEAMHNFEAHPVRGILLMDRLLKKHNLTPTPRLNEMLHNLINFVTDVLINDRIEKMGLDYINSCKEIFGIHLLTYEHLKAIYKDILPWKTLDDYYDWHRRERIPIPEDEYLVEYIFDKFVEALKKAKVIKIDEKIPLPPLNRPDLPIPPDKIYEIPPDFPFPIEGDFYRETREEAGREGRTPDYEDIKRRVDKTAKPVGEREPTEKDIEATREALERNEERFVKPITGSVKVIDETQKVKKYFDEAYERKKEAEAEGDKEKAAEAWEEAKRWSRVIEELEREAKRRARDLREVEQQQRGAGLGPGCMSRYVDRLVDVMIPFDEKFSYAISNIVSEATTYTWRLTEIHPAVPGMVPHREYLDKPKVWIAIDTSGSISYHDLILMASVIEGLVKTQQVKEAIVIPWDDAVYGEIRVEKTGDFMKAVREGRLKGGGGTDPTHVFDYLVEKIRRGELEEDDIVIMMSDGYWARDPVSLAEKIRKYVGTDKALYISVVDFKYGEVIENLPESVKKWKIMRILGREK